MRILARLGFQDRRENYALFYCRANCVIEAVEVDKKNLQPERVYHRRTDTA